TVGAAGSVQGVQGTLNVENPASLNALVVDDSADSAARTVTLSTFAPNPSDSEGNNDPWGAISGLAPAAINYEYADTAGVTISSGTAGDTFNVGATGVPTTINTGGGADTV